MCEREKMEHTCPKCNLKFERYEYKGRVNYRCNKCHYRFYEIDGIPEFEDGRMERRNGVPFPTDFLYRKSIMKQHKRHKLWDVNRGTKHPRTQPLPKRQEKRYRFSEYDGSIR